MGRQAFDAKRSQLFWLDPDDIVVIGLDTDDGPEHELWDKRATLPVDDKLATNIAFLGKVLEPISVRKNGDTAEVIFGRQRVKAARKANETLRARGAEPVLVPCQLDRAQPERILGMMVSENEHRQGMSPLEKATLVARYMDHGHDERDAAKLLGDVSVQTVRSYLSLLDLDSSVQKMVEDGRLSATAAGKLASLDRKDQRVEAKKLLDSGKATAAAAGRAARAKKNGGDGGPVAPSKRQLRKLLAAHEAADFENALPEGFVRGIKYCLGELSTSAVHNLAALLEDA